MFYLPTASRSDMEIVILEDDDLMAEFDETKLMASDYTDDEMRSTIQAWVEAGDECASA